MPPELLSKPNLAADRQLAYTRSVQNHEYNKKRYDCTRNNVDFKIGDRVYVDNGNK